MSSLKYIFAQPDYIETVGNIYPIRLKDYEIFQECSKILYISRNHFVETDIPLLNLIFLSSEYLGFSIENLIKIFEDLFSLALRDEVSIYIEDDIFYFKSKNNKIINTLNYDKIRSIIMKQNLMFEQKVYKNPKVQEWANKAIEAKAKDSPKISIEDIITTVSIYKGVSYYDLMEYTIYQIYADFYRIRKLKKYDADIIFATVSDEITIEDFAEEVNLFKNPYDDLFVNKDKLSKLNKAVGV